jgi:atypical dual specificity phosphatase
VDTQSQLNTVIGRSSLQYCEFWRHNGNSAIMAQPSGFTWIEKPLLAAMARPEALEDLNWLRKQGIELLISLTEDPPRRDWVNNAGLLLIHEPMIDMSAPDQDQLERCVSAMLKAHERKMGVAIHCAAGLGRTGVVLACFFIDKGLNATNAIARVRRLRPGSIETEDQEEAVKKFFQSRQTG